MSAHLSTSPLPLPGAQSGVSPRRGGQKSATAIFFLSLVSLYGDRRPGPAPFGCRERGACTEGRCSPFASIFGSESNRNRTETRGGDEGGGEGGAFPPSWKPAVCSMAS